MKSLYFLALLSTLNLSMSAYGEIGRSQAYQGIENLMLDFGNDVPKIGKVAKKVTISRYSQDASI